jgi:hypothetical protein
LAGNRFLVPALLEYLRKPVARVPVAATVPLRFTPAPVSTFWRQVYFWSNGLLCLFLAALGIRICWRESRDQA